MQISRVFALSRIKYVPKLRIKNLITNCAVTTDDISRAELIYGPSVPFLEGNIMKHKPPIPIKIEKDPFTTNGSSTSLNHRTSYREWKHFLSY